MSFDSGYKTKYKCTVLSINAFTKNFIIFIFFLFFKAIYCLAVCRAFTPMEPYKVNERELSFANKAMFVKNDLDNM